MPGKLILSLDGLVLKEFPLNKERITIGRRPHNDIHIDNLAVSGEHAAIVTILNDSFLEDLGSTNGTLVNGTPIQKHFLQNSDVVEIGKYKLKYINEQAGQGAAADFEKTMVLRSPVKTAAAAAPRAQTDTQANMASALAGRAPGDTHPGSSGPRPSSTVPPTVQPPPPPPPQPAPAAAAAPAPAPAPAAAPAPAPVPAAAGGRPVIQLLSGANAGRELELTKTLTTLGKPGFQVAVITRRPNGFFITHVEGSTFPIVNGQSVGAQPHQLADHDVLELAGVKMEFYLKS